MKKILTTGLSENIRIQFEKILELVAQDISFIHAGFPENFMQKVKEELPDILVVQIQNEKNKLTEFYRLLKSEAQTESMTIVILFDENSFTGNPGELLKNCDGLLSFPFKTWEVISLFHLLLKGVQKNDSSSASVYSTMSGEKTINIVAGEEQFRKIVEGAPDPIFIQTEMKFAYLNNAACRLFGINSASELIGKPIMERFHPDFHEKIKKRIHYVNDLKQRVTELFEQKFIRMDGSEVWVETAGEPINYEGKDGALVFVRDITKRKESEILLKQSEERWQFALEGAGDGVWDWNLKDNKLFFSNQWKNMLGYQPDEVKNELAEWESRVHPEDLTKAYEDVNKHLNGETAVYQNEHRLRCKDGSYRWILDRGKVISYDEDGKPERFIGIHTDINEFKMSEKALKESENRFRSTLDSMLEGCQIIGFNWDYLYLNEAAVKQSHLNRDDLTGKNFVKMWPGIENTTLFKKMKRCMKKRIPVHMENLFNYPDGSVGWFELSIQPVSEGIFILSVDITERKTAEEKLHESEERYRLILDNSLDALLLTSPDGSVYSANKSACDMFGMTEEEICWAGRKGLVDLEDPNLPKLLEERKRTGKAKGELRFKRKDGTIFPTEISASIFKNNHGETRNSMVIRDISERKQAENKLRELKDSLEMEVAFKTKELRERVAELERFQEATIEREYRIKELRDEIDKLKK